MRAQESCPTATNRETAQDTSAASVDVAPIMADATGTALDMTRAERMELSKLVRLRAKVSRTQADQRAAEQRADVERQLSATYKFSDAAWADVTAATQQAVADGNALVAARCSELGIPVEFAPSMSFGWYSRGENACRDRRAELRKTAQAAIEAAAKQAKATIEARSLDVQTVLLAGGLTTSAAHAFLTAMPTPAELMPAIDVKMIGGPR